MHTMSLSLCHTCMHEQNDPNLTMCVRLLVSVLVIRTRSTALCATYTHVMTLPRCSGHHWFVTEQSRHAPSLPCVTHIRVVHAHTCVLACILPPNHRVYVRVHTYALAYVLAWHSPQSQRRSHSLSMALVHFADSQISCDVSN